MAGEFTSLESCLEKYLPPRELEEVKRILYGKPVRYFVVNLLLAHNLLSVCRKIRTIFAQCCFWITLLAEPFLTVHMLCMLPCMKERDKRGSARRVFLAGLSCTGPK